MKALCPHSSSILHSYFGRLSSKNVITRLISIESQPKKIVVVVMVVIGVVVVVDVVVVVISEIYF